MTQRSSWQTGTFYHPNIGQTRMRYHTDPCDCHIFFPKVNSVTVVHASPTWNCGTDYIVTTTVLKRDVRDSPRIMWHVVNFTGRWFVFSWKNVAPTQAPWLKPILSPEKLWEGKICCARVVFASECHICCPTPAMLSHIIHDLVTCVCQNQPFEGVVTIVIYTIICLKSVCLATFAE